MKIDKFVNQLWNKANNLATATNNEIDPTNHDNDDYYIYHDKTGSVPPRFLAYRHARWEKLDDRGKLTCQDVDKTITQDELDFMLKRYLAVSPEQRYQDQKANRFFHELGCYVRGLGPDDWDKGCHDDQCIAECPFYPEYGSISDEHVIKEHNERVERYRLENRIVEPPTEEEIIRLLNELLT